MEQAASDISRNMYADYGAFAVMVMLLTAILFFGFRYFSGELRACREQLVKSDADWRQRYDSIVERMINQAAAQGQVLERMAERLKRDG